MTETLDNIIKQIDENITALNSNQLNIKDSLILLKETTNLLSSANDIIISKHNTINEESNSLILTNSLEKYYNNLSIKKKIISGFTEKYKKLIEGKEFLEKNEEIDSDDENDSLIKKGKRSIQLEYIMDKNEELINRGYKGLEDIQNDMGEIKNSVNKQGQNITTLENGSIQNEHMAKNANGVIDEILSNQNCSKILLGIINILLFVLILATIIYKILWIYKYLIKFLNNYLF